MRGSLQQELAKMRFALPVMPLLAEHLKQHGVVKGKTIGWHCHLTEITAAAAEPLLEAGARLVMCECNPETTHAESVEYMRAKGATIFLGENSCAQVLKEKPRVISDTGFVLTRNYLAANHSGFIFAASEITTSGISAAAETKSSIPVIDINSGDLKTYIENYHGVADGLIDLLAQLTGKVWSGKPAAVIGYGAVGKGIAAYLRRAGAEVAVVEIDPVRKLIAHYDGFRLSSLADAMAGCDLVITATGKETLIGEQQWQTARDGALFVNVGHWAGELDIAALQRLAGRGTDYAPFMKEYVLPAGRRIYVIAEGGPANVVTLSGSVEPTLIHLTTEILCMNYLLDCDARAVPLEPGIQALPAIVEWTAAELALQALNLSN